jgi:hypothetical protein
MKRFVVVATAKRGALSQYEPLDEDGQAAALSRIELEMESRGERVVWKKDCVPEKLLERSKEPRQRVQRMMGLSRAAG